MFIHQNSLKVIPWAASSLWTYSESDSTSSLVLLISMSLL